MKKLFVAIAAVTVMLTSGVMMNVSAKEHQPVITETKEAKKNNTSKNVKAKEDKTEKKFENMVIDEIEGDYETYIKSVKITHMNRKKTRFSFEAEDVNGRSYSGSAKLNKLLGAIDCTDWTIFH